MPNVWAKFLVLDSAMTVAVAAALFYWVQAGDVVATVVALVGLLLWKLGGYRLLIRHRPLVSPKFSEYIERLQDFSEQEARRLRWEAQREPEGLGRGRVRPGDEL